MEEERREEGKEEGVVRKLKSEGKEVMEGQRDTGRREGKEGRREEGRQVSQMDGPAFYMLPLLALPVSVSFTPGPCLIVFPTLTFLHSPFTK